MEDPYYIIGSEQTKLHITPINGKMLCGGHAQRHWEFRYEELLFPEIESNLSFDKHLKTPDYQNGLSVKGRHIPKCFFCKKCYSKFVLKIQK